MDTDDVISALVDRGAALVFAADPNQNAYGVAWWRRVNAHRLFWHAPGVSDFDHHVLNFAREDVSHHQRGVAFRDKNGKQVAYLSRIHEAETDSVAARSLAASIAWWKAEFNDNAGLRDAVLGAYEAAGRR